MENRQPSQEHDPGTRGRSEAGSNGSDPHRGGAPPPRDPDPAALVLLLDALRIAAPPELQDRLTALIREALLTLRSLIDWYLERLDAPEPDRTVEDIPID